MAMKMCVLQWLEETVRNYPDKTAFVDERTSYTYGEVRQRALA